MHIRLDLANLTPLNLGPHHERVHRSLDVVWIVLLRLHKQETTNEKTVNYTVQPYDRAMHHTHTQLH